MYIHMCKFAIYVYTYTYMYICMYAFVYLSVWILIGIPPSIYIASTKYNQALRDVRNYFDHLS